MEMFTTMITPFSADGKVDYQTAQKYVDWYFENGIDGIFSVCQSSEIFYLSLPERVELNRLVYTRAKELEKTSGRKFTVVSSGHVSSTLEEQAEELGEIWNSGCDALILITNRLDIHNEGDAVFLRNMEALMKRLPSDVRLGLYECPYPYKRLVTPEILKWCVSTGKFDYMKDTCCDIETIRSRCKILEGSGFKLLNANCQTLLESMQCGGSGYCGIMCNYHPKLYAWLRENYKENEEQAKLVQGVMCAFGFTESVLPYPLTAKYHMGLCGIPTENIARNQESGLLTDYAKDCMRQMKRVTDYMEEKMKCGGAVL